MQSKLKILQVIPKLGYGGAETGCYDLAHYLAEKDCKSFIATSGGDLLKYIRKGNKYLVCFEMMDSLWYKQTPYRVKNLVRTFLKNEQ